MKEDYFFDLESNESDLKVDLEVSDENYLVTDTEHDLSDYELAEINAEMNRLDQLKNMKN